MHRSWRARLAAGCAIALLSAAGLAQGQNVVVVPVGAVPRGVAVYPALNVALVANFGESTLSVVDLSTEKLLATIQDMSTPAGVAVNTSTGVAVVANQGNSTVTVVDIATRRIRGVVSVGFSPIAVAVNPVTNVAVVANSNSNTLSIVDLAALREVKTVQNVPNATGIQSVAVDPDLNVAVVASSTQNSLVVVDLSTATIKTQIPVEQSPSGVSIEPGSKTAVVTNQNSNSVSLVDLRTNTVRATVPSIRSPQAVAVAVGSLSALVTTDGNSTLEVVNLATAKVVTSITNLPTATSVAYNERTGRTVVALPSSNSVAILRSLGQFTTGPLTTVRGAAFQPGPVAPSSIVAGFASPLASSTASASSVPLPTALGGISVRVGGVVAPLFFVSQGQINYQIPVLTAGIYNVEVFSGSQLLTSGGVVVVAASPDLFTVNQQGTGQAAALNQDNSLNSSSRPALRGSFIQLFATGGGATSPNPPAGSAASSAASTVLTPTAQIGGVSATVAYSGASPGLVGVWQINLQIPSTITAGSAVPVQVSIGGRTSNTVTIAVE